MPLLGRHEAQKALFQYVDLDDLVPKNHLLRRLDAAIDLSFVRELVRPLYADDGRPSIDPEVQLRAIPLQHLFNESENNFSQELKMYAGYLWFCGLSFNDPVPDCSTLHKTRDRWSQAGVFDAILARVAQQCIDAGIIKG